MKRSHFIKLGALAAAGIATGSIMSKAMNLQSLKKWAGNQAATDRMPVMFVGHGNPMNAITQNEFAATWQQLGKSLPRPKAILSISAHWLTKGTAVTAMAMPRTIHDFGGFPKELFDQQYPVKGAPELAHEVTQLVTRTMVHEDHDWGLDHGTWSVLKPMFPEADIPVFQLSLDYYKSPQYHYELAQQLKELRYKGVLIMGSGNIVHNLGMVDFRNHTEYDWAASFDARIKSFIDSGDHKSIIQYEQLGNEARMAVPTNDHYLPLLYPLALQDKKDGLHYFNEKMDLGAISMRSVLLG